MCLQGEKEDINMMIKESIRQGNVTVLSEYVRNNRTSKYIK